MLDDRRGVRPGRRLVDVRATDPGQLRDPAPDEVTVRIVAANQTTAVEDTARLYRWGLAWSPA